MKNGTLMSAGKPYENFILTYVQCALCVKEKPADITPRDWARFNVGFTTRGVQVWCTRHECNVMHIDFEGHKHPADTGR